MKPIDAILSHPLAYRLWQAPFADQKLRPLFEYSDVSAARRVLDLGCGPGTNARHFERAEYLGIDLNPDYIEYAKRRCRGAFVAGDAVRCDLPLDHFDLVLVNSFLHHLDDEDCGRVLSRVAASLAHHGHAHVFELVMPTTASAARLLARWDRGRHARTPEHWESIVTGHLEPVVFHPYPLAALGVTLWEMVYLKARRKRR